MTGVGHVLNFLSVFVSLYFRIAFSGSECLLLSFLCALSRLLCSFPIMLCFQPLCCLVSCFFFSPVECFPVASHAPSPFRGFSAGAAGRSGPSYTAQICIFLCQFIPFQTMHSLPLNVCMFHFHSLDYFYLNLCGLRFHFFPPFAARWIRYLSFSLFHTFISELSLP